MAMSILAVERHPFPTSRGVNLGRVPSQLQVRGCTYFIIMHLFDYVMVSYIIAYKMLANNVKEKGKIRFPRMSGNSFPCVLPSPPLCVYTQVT